jgi:hypothetical protein
MYLWIRRATSRGGFAANAVRTVTTSRRFGIVRDNQTVKSNKKALLQAFVEEGLQRT